MIESLPANAEEASYRSASLALKRGLAEVWRDLAAERNRMTAAGELPGPPSVEEARLMERAEWFERGLQALERDKHAASRREESQREELRAQSAAIASRAMDRADLWAAAKRLRTARLATQEPSEVERVFDFALAFLPSALAEKLGEFHREWPVICDDVDGQRYLFWIDFAAPGDKIGIELDGYQYHSDKDSFRNDRRRDRILKAAGWEILRFAASDVFRNAEVAVQLAARTVLALREERDRRLLEAMQRERGRRA